MNTNRKIINSTEDAPAHWASYLVNGDASGLDDKDVELADQFQNDIAPSYVVSCEDDTFLANYKGLITEMITYNLHTIEEG